MIRAGKKKRLGGLSKTGYCASLKRYFHGVREHLIVTPDGYIACVLQLAGNRHDVNGLYEFLKNSFAIHLIGDKAYWPKASLREELAAQSVTVTAPVRSNMKAKNTAAEKKLLKKRGRIERIIGLFDRQFHADRTLNRSRRHYEARRWTKVVAHNLSRHINVAQSFPIESLQHYRLAS